MAKTKIDDEIIRSIYINPLTDFGFKKLFLNKDLLIAFLNDVVGTNIRDIQYQPTESLGEQADERVAIFDILCTGETGEYFIVEMQLGSQLFFQDRVLFYASHAIRRQAPKKKFWNYKLKAVYVVAILDFITFTEEQAKDEVIERAYLYREKAKKRYSEKLNFVFIELPKFNKSVTELVNNTETWLYLLKHTFELSWCPQEITGRVFKRFLEMAEIKQLTPIEMETYTKNLRKNRFILEMATCERLEGERKGRMEGRQEVAVKLLQRKTPVEDIVSLTDLTEEQVLELSKQY